MKVFFILFACIMSASSAVSQELPDAPQPHHHRFLTIDNGLAVSDVVVRSIDTYSTHQFLTNPCGCWHEIDPIAPHGAAYGPLIAFQAGFAAAFITINHFAQKNHHHWVRVGGRLLIAGDIVDEAYWDKNNLDLKVPVSH